MNTPATAIRHLIDLLLWFLPPEKRRKWRRGIFIVLGVAFMVIVALFGVQWIGPSADGPTVDPLARMRARARSFERNAADVYAAAIRLRTPPPGEGWRQQVGLCKSPLPEDLAAWLDENAASLKLTHEAAGVADCWFDVKRRPDGSLDLYALQPLRDQVKFVALYARLAAERRDISSLADAVETVGGAARHMATVPGVIGQLYATAARSYAYLYYPAPYEWDDLTPAQLDEYRARLADVLAADADMHQALSEERDELSWFLREAGFGQAAYFVPYRRCNGELELALRPYLALAQQPPHVWADKDNQLWREVREMHAWPKFAPAVVVNVPRWTARAMVNFERVFDLLLRAAAIRRGLLTIDAIFEYKQRHGEWPASLDALECESVIDPYGGDAFVYRLTDAGFTLYSVGVDGDDDGGAHDERFGEKKVYGDRPQPPPDGDYVFWPLQREDS